MDRDMIATELAKDLDRRLVKPPPPGKYGDYVPAFDIITTANKIFGWDGWSYRVVKLEQTNCDPNQGKNSDQWAIGYMAIVKVVIPTGDTDGAMGREDVGHGQGHSKSLGDAHDSAMKEAVTDALKRALRTFGNPLGLALYDKDQKHVSNDPDYDPKGVADRLLEALKHTADCDLAKWSTSNRDDVKRLRRESHDDYKRVRDECDSRITAPPIKPEEDRAEQS